MLIIFIEFLRIVLSVLSISCKDNKFKLYMIPVTSKKKGGQVEVGVKLAHKSI